MRDYVDRRVTPPKRVTSPTWGAPPSCKQDLNKAFCLIVTINVLYDTKKTTRKNGLLKICVGNSHNCAFHESIL